MTTTIQPDTKLNYTDALSGRFMARAAQDNNAFMVGVLRFPSDFIPVESALYLLSTYANTVSVSNAPVGDVLADDLQGNGVTNTLTDKCWAGTKLPATMTVRFIKAFPDENAWTVYGAANQDILPGHGLDKTTGIWCDITKGRWRVIDAPAVTTGLTASLILRNLFVWPNRYGVLHNLPDIESAWRSAYHEHSLLLSCYGKKRLTKTEVQEIVATNSRIAKVYSGIDEQFCAYLAALEALGGINDGVLEPMTQIEQEHREALTMQALRQTDPSMTLDDGNESSMQL